MAGFIQGNLPFGASAANILQPGNTAGNYANAYMDALNTNKQNYANILGGYQQTAAENRAEQARVAQGYRQLNTDVQNKLAGSNASNIQSINDRYSQDWAKAQQGLTSAGLGNTTIVPSVQRGYGLDRAKAVTDSENKFAQLQANYMSGIGQAGLGYEGNAIRDNTAQANRQLDWMNSVQAKYPDAASYMALAQMQGAARNRGGGMMPFGLPQGRPANPGFDIGFPPGPFPGRRGPVAPGQLVDDVLTDRRQGRDPGYPMPPQAEEEWPYGQTVEPPMFGQSDESYANAPNSWPAYPQMGLTPFPTRPSNPYLLDVYGQ